jgi:transposase-like protein
MDGRKEVLGLWTSGNEGAKFWLAVLTERKNRGVKDVLIASVDGLKGFPQAIESVFPQTRIQLCIVHVVRASLNYVNWKERKLVAMASAGSTERWQVHDEIFRFRCSPSVDEVAIADIRIAGPNRCQWL